MGRARSAHRRRHAPRATAVAATAPRESAATAVRRTSAVIATTERTTRVTSAGEPSAGVTASASTVPSAMLGESRDGRRNECEQESDGKKKLPNGGCTHVNPSTYSLAAVWENNHLDEVLLTRLEPESRPEVVRACQELDD